MQIKTVMTATAGWLCFTVVDAHAIPTYTIQPLPVPADSTRSYASAINDAGQVATSVWWQSPSPMDPSPRHPFLWNGTASVDLFANSAYFRGEVTGISPSGQAVGFLAGTPAHPWLAFSYKDGILSTFDTPAAADSFALAVNASGDVVGAINNPDSHPTRWRNGVAEALPTPPQGNGSAIGINAAGTILITSYDLSGKSLAWFTDGHTLTPIASPSNLNLSIDAVALNDLSHIVGTTMPPGGSPSPFLFSGGTLSILPTPQTATRGAAQSINNQDQVVGYVIYGIDGFAATLWDGGTMYDLNTLIPSDSGWTLTGATAINNLGQIVGTGTYQGRDTAFLLTPTSQSVIPEPSMIALTASATLLLARRRRRITSRPRSI